MTNFANHRLQLLRCTGRNKGHNEFIAMNQLNRNHLTPGFQRQLVLEFVKVKSVNAVKITVGEKSDERPPYISSHTRGNSSGSGTAFISSNMEQQRTCLDPNCSVIDTQPHHHQTSGTFRVLTTDGTVYDDFEAGKAEVEFFFEEDEDTIKAQGLNMVSVSHVEGVCVIECVTHDLDLYGRMRQCEQKKIEIMKMISKSNAYIIHSAPCNAAIVAANAARSIFELMVVVISHPHAEEKHVSIGQLKAVRRVHLVDDAADAAWADDDGPVICNFHYTAATCEGSGGGSVNFFDLAGRLVGFATHVGFAYIARREDDAGNPRDVRLKTAHGWITKPYAPPHLPKINL